MSEQIARKAAELYGQKWDALPLHSQSIWIALVRDTTPGGGQTAAEKCAGQALLGDDVTVDEDDETPKLKLPKAKK